MSIDLSRMSAKELSSLIRDATERVAGDRKSTRLNSGHRL